MLPVEGELPPLDGLGPWINSAAADPREAAGQGRADRLLDLQLHQLPALDPLCPGLAREIREGRPGRHRRPRARIRVRAQSRQCRARRSRDLGIRYPVALDNQYGLWGALKNRYWPAHYFVDAKGRVRYHHFGEGKYAESERVIRQLLAEAGRAPKGGGHGPGGAQSGAPKPRPPRRHSSSPRPISATAAPTVSSRPAG